VTSSAVAILAVVGASGVGKTTAVRALAERNLPAVGCYYFDSIGVPSAETMERDSGGGTAWQAAMTDRWIERLSANADDVDVAVLDAQTRPSFVRQALTRCAVRCSSIILLDCSPAVRCTRLHGPRAQPELATPQMDSWAAYLRGQADARGLSVYDTEAMNQTAGVDALAAHVETLKRDNAPGHANRRTL
jgi:hypothetical protein